MAGRPRKFATVEELERLINEYFESCYEEVWKEGRDKKTKKTKWEPVLDRHGNIQKRLAQRPCITGLAVALDTTRRTLLDYEEGKYDTEDNKYSHTIKKAKALCEHYAEQGTINGEIPPGAGIFILKNYGWTDKQEHEITGDAVLQIKKPEDI